MRILRPTIENRQTGIQALVGIDASAHEHFSGEETRRGKVPSTVIDEAVDVLIARLEWADWFRDEADHLRNELPPGLAPAIEHIGSTSVVGLDAKPIIDIMVAIAEPARIAEFVERLERLGYENLGEAGIPGRWALRRRGERQYNIAVIGWNGERWRTNLLVRDYLRANPEIGRDYAEEKWRALREGATSLLSYSEHKRSAIEAVVEKCLAAC